MIRGSAAPHFDVFERGGGVAPFHDTMPYVMWDAINGPAAGNDAGTIVTAPAFDLLHARVSIKIGWEEPRRADTAGHRLRACRRAGDAEQCRRGLGKHSGWGV